MKALYDLSAPAKLNLFLHITGQRADGYHYLQSVFMLVDICDTIHLELRSDGQITREDFNTADTNAPLPPSDLCVRAARALQTASGTRLGCHISLQKRIPQQAGLGGGSSDAATCLLGLSRLWNLRVQLSNLEQIGLQLGADVPFFLHGHNAWVEGVGERITPLTPPHTLAPQRFVVVKPLAGLSTQAVFSAPDLERNAETATIQGFAANAYGFGHNSLQAVAKRLCPEVDEALQWLQTQGLQPRMTGSGSAVFAPVPPGWHASQPPKAWWVRTCSNLSAHPLQGWAL
jgi:4-diphosphocytidyl-2-C-methyl-D-erythritol kinase